MSATVNIDSFALTDLWLKKLGKAVFGADEPHAHDLALAKMIRIWHHCTERGVHSISSEEAELLTDIEEFAEKASEAKARRCPQREPGAVLGADLCGGIGHGLEAH